MKGSDFSPTAIESSEALLEASKDGVRGIIVDSDLPDCELSTTLKSLRQQAPTVPIVVTHTSDDPHDIQLAFEHGATWVVTKPYDPREILNFFIANPMPTSAAQLL